jgi:hypothetical protein
MTATATACRIHLINPVSRTAGGTRTVALLLHRGTRLGCVCRYVTFSDLVATVTATSGLLFRWLWSGVSVRFHGTLSYGTSMMYYSNLVTVGLQPAYSRQNGRTQLRPMIQAGLTTD